MPRCRTCKHWKLDTYWMKAMAENPDGDGFGECRGMKAHSEIEFSVDNGWLTEIGTGANFGCVAHEAKE